KINMKKIKAIITMQDNRNLTFELYPEVAPITVSNFVDLANSGFYDGLPFHRIKKDWVLQGGSTDGTCESPTEFSIKGEFLANGVENNIKHKKGTISMGRYDHFDSAGVQFFIVHMDYAESLDGKYAGFGKLIDGEDLLEELANVETDTTPGRFNPPIVPVIIKSIRVIEGDFKLGKAERIYPAVSKEYTGNAS
ncbi:MAG: peptidylprolyl isomerase, partial [Cetobacterium sp.]